MGKLTGFPADAAATLHASAMTGSFEKMVERVAVLLGTVQFRLKLKVSLPESATLADAQMQRDRRSPMVQQGNGR